MNISKAKRIIELSKPGSSRKILVTVWQDDKISSCVEEEASRFCETCDADDELCQEWLAHLEGKGYTASEIELDELEPEESLPRFVEEKQVEVIEEVE